MLDKPRKIHTESKTERVLQAASLELTTAPFGLREVSLESILKALGRKIIFYVLITNLLRK